MGEEEGLHAERHPRKRAGQALLRPEQEDPGASKVRRRTTWWQPLVIGGVAVVAGGATQTWPLFYFGVGLMGSATLASVVMEDHTERKV